MEGFLLSNTAIALEKIAAYKSTNYCVGETDSAFTLRIDVPSEDLQQLYQVTGLNCAIFITAFNPYGTEQEVKANLTAHAQLGDYLHTLSPRVIEGAGTNPSGEWPPERSFLALSIDHSTACRLGNRVHQDAVVWAGADAVPRLVLLR